jgi:TM2 domain-containing membrane protein YozV
LSHGHVYAISPVIHKWFFWKSRLQHKCTWWLQVLWKFWIFLKFLKFWNFKICENFVKILKFWTLTFLFFLFENFYFFFENFEILWNFMKTEIFEIFEILQKNSGFLDSDDNARGSRITITVVCSISDVQLKFRESCLSCQ